MTVKRIIGVFTCVMLFVCIMGCSSQANSSQNNEAAVDKVISTEKSNNETVSEGIAMKMFINDTEVPVIWEKNEAVDALMKDVAKGDIVVAMSMYSNNEQVGSLGKRYPSNDKQITTRNGDIVLYNSSNLVVFYQPNSWAYTKIGRMDLSDTKVTELLSNGDVTITLKN